MCKYESVMTHAIVMRFVRLIKSRIYSTSSQKHAEYIRSTYIFNYLLFKFVIFNFFFYMLAQHLSLPQVHLFHYISGSWWLICSCLSFWMYALRTQPQSRCSWMFNQRVCINCTYRNCLGNNKNATVCISFLWITVDTHIDSYWNVFVLNPVGD